MDNIKESNQVKVNIEQLNPNYQPSPINNIEKELFEDSIKKMLIKKGYKIKEEEQTIDKEQEMDEQLISELRWEDLDERQKKHLGSMTRFTSTNRNTFTLIGNTNISRKQELFIKTNLNYLTADQIVKYNDEQLNFATHRTNSKGIMTTTFCSFMLYYFITAPATRKLSKEVFKSLGYGLVLGSCYYKYQEAIYKEKIYKFYLIIKTKKAALD